MKGGIVILFAFILVSLLSFVLASSDQNFSQATGEVVSPLCGNGILNQNEQCDWGKFNGKPCIPSGQEVCFYCAVDCSYGTLSKEPVGTQESKCIDSDGGTNIFVKGTTTGYIENSNGAPYKGTYSDYCQDSQIVELSCIENSFINYAPLSCPKGYSCQSGACIENGKLTVSSDVSLEQKNETSTNQETGTCTDSDSGLDIYVKGKITYTDNPLGIIEEYDSCLTEKTLVERSCFDATNTEKNFKEYNCLKGCIDGACKKSFLGTVLQGIKKILSKK